jgi:hypothetical protein
MGLWHNLLGMGRSGKSMLAMVLLVWLATLAAQTNLFAATTEQYEAESLVVLNATAGDTYRVFGQGAGPDPQLRDRKSVV